MVTYSILTSQVPMVNSKVLATTTSWPTRVNSKVPNLCMELALGRALRIGCISCNCSPPLPVPNPNKHHFFTIFTTCLTDKLPDSFN